MKCLLGLMVFVFLAASPAQALPFTAVAGDTLVFNFDLTGQTPPAPYGTVGMKTGLDSASVSEFDDLWTWTVWGDLNATGALLFAFQSPDVVIDVTFFSSPTLSDGIFSSRLVVTSGSIVIDPCAFALSESGILTPCVAGNTAVPEPMTLSLLGVGLAGIFMRRYQLTARARIL